MSAKRAIGVDVGGTNIRSGLVDSSGVILARDRRPTGGAGGRDAVIENIAAAVRAVCEEPDIPVGIGFPGPLDPAAGIVYRPPNLPGWAAEPLRELVGNLLGHRRRVEIENDANCWGLGEAWLGAGRGMESVILLTLGTGIGGSLIIDGKVRHGAHGVGCEIGHIVYDARGHPCNCGGRGCIEQYASAGGIVRRAAEGIGRGERTVLSPGGLTAAAVYEAAAAGDAFARGIIEETGRILGVVLTSLCNFFDPALIVVGGGAAGAGEMLFGPMRAQVEAAAMRMPGGLPPIVPPRLGEDAGMIGAARLVMA